MLREPPIVDPRRDEGLLSSTTVMMPARTRNAACRTG